MPSNALSFADEGSPFDLTAVPETIVLAADRSRLRLAWSNGERSELLAEQLRGACRCAWCTRARIDGNFAASVAWRAPPTKVPKRAQPTEMVAGAIAPAVPHDEPLE
jgi:hypothetical protein